MSKPVLLAALTVLLASMAAAALSMPVAASQSHTGATGESETGAPAVPRGLIPEDDTVGPVGIVNELYEAHSTITDIMVDHSKHDYSRADDIVFTMTFVDEDEERLHVILNPVLLTLGLNYGESDIKPLLEIGADRIEVRYGVFVPEGHIYSSPQSQIDLWISLYEARCDSATASRLCEALYFNLATQHHYVLDSNEWQPPGTPEPEPEPPAPEPVAMPATLSTTVFSDDFEDGLGSWTNSGRYSWESGRFDENVNPPGHNSTNNVASADRCITQCVLTITPPLDLSSDNRTSLAFYRYVEDNLDAGEYLGVEVTTGNGTWTRLAEWAGNSGDDDSAWHFERLDITPYISDEFQVRFVARMSSSSEDVGIDDVTISRVMEFYGGNNYTMFFTNSSGQLDNSAGTITIGITNGSTGIKGIMTAGHVIELDPNKDVFHNHTMGVNHTVFNRNPDGLHETARLDAAFVPIEGPNVIVGSKVQALNGTVMNVTHGSLSDVSRLSKVHIYGAINNDDGFLLFKNATVHDIYSYSISSMGVATYGSNNGDSGAPIIHHNSSGFHNLVGIHMGGVCAFESPSEGQPRMINVSSYARWCDDFNDSYYYKTFSAWENVVKLLNLR